MSSSEDSSPCCSKASAFEKCEVNWISTVTWSLGDLLFLSFITGSADRPGDLFRLNFLDVFDDCEDRIELFESFGSLLRVLSGRTDAMLGCPYESLAKRSLASSLSAADGDAAAGAKASRVCFLWDLRGMAEVRVEMARGV